MGVKQNPRYAAVIVVCCSLLVACGGGGGGSSPGAPPTVTPTNTTTPIGPTTTNASGTVVDDGTGAPLAGVSVKLMPWAPCNTNTPLPNQAITPENDDCPTPLPSPQATTAANGTFTLANAPNGHYLLVIGSDTVVAVPSGYTNPPTSCGGPCPTPSPYPGTSVQAAVHDNVTLTGGNQTLVAPTLPAVPSGYTAPAWETNGDYRLATLNATTEMPCLIAWQYERENVSLLAGASVDEWLIENVRADNAYAQVAPAGSTYSTLTSDKVATTGGVACAGSIAAAFGPNASVNATDPHVVWFSGQYAYSGAVGLAQFPIDPRQYTDPNHPSWP